MRSVLTECPPDLKFEYLQLQCVTALADEPIRILWLEFWFTITVKIRRDTTSSGAKIRMLSIWNCHVQIQLHKLS
jgi:hypothetical protein